MVDENFHQQKGLLSFAPANDVRSSPIKRLSAVPTFGAFDLANEYPRGSVFGQDLR